MKFIKKYKVYLESLDINLSTGIIDLMESLNIWQDALLSSINAEKVDIFKSFNLDNTFKNKLDIDILNNNVEFLNSLSSIGLKKSQVQNTEDFSTFLNKPCKFMFIFDINSNELENPEYIIIQTWNKTLNKWEDLQLFKVKDDIKKFFDKLSSKTIEIIENGGNYIYTTSNGSEWLLGNTENMTKVYKKVLRIEDLESILRNKNIKISII